MKRIEIADATASLSDYTRRTRKEPLLVTRHGKPVAALMPLTKADWETISLSTNLKFMAIIKHSRTSHKRGLGLSTEAMRRRLGSKRKTG